MPLISDISVNVIQIIYYNEQINKPDTFNVLLEVTKIVIQTKYRTFLIDLSSLNLMFIINFGWNQDMMILLKYTT